jgi:hypothetical protein
MEAQFTQEEGYVASISDIFYSLSFAEKPASSVIELKMVVIACSLAIFSATEMEKLRSHWESRAQLLQIPATLEWLDFQAQLHVQISDMLYPNAAKINYSKFEPTYTIPHHVPNALPLLSSLDYDYLLKNAMKVKDPSGKIIIVETGPQQQV